MKIMIVDDEPIVLKGLFSIITSCEDLSTDVLCASDGVEALDHLVDFMPDCVITDICMPEMNGLEMIDKIIKTGICVRFIILTCHAEFHYAQEAIKYRVVDYLMKPINKDRLIELLKDISEDLLESKSLAVRKILEHVNNNYMSDISLDDIAQKVNLHPNYASALFKKQTGMSFVHCLNSCRISKAKALITKYPDMPINKVAKMTGFQSMEHFYKVFKKISKITPGNYRLDHLDQTVEMNHETY